MNLVNFRDVASTAGPHLRAGRLYRSAQRLRTALTA